MESIGTEEDEAETQKDTADECEDFHGDTPGESFRPEWISGVRPVTAATGSELLTLFRFDTLLEAVQNRLPALALLFFGVGLFGIKCLANFDPSASLRNSTKRTQSPRALFLDDFGVDALKVKAAAAVFRLHTR
jgi:hypothetical protein